MPRPDAPIRTHRRGLAAVAIAIAVALISAGAPLSASATPLPTSGTISGTVSDAGVPVAGVSVIVSSNSVSQSVQTNDVGAYSFGALPFGTYSVSTLATIDSVYQSTAPVSATISASVPTRVRNLSLERWPTGDGVISGTVSENGVGVSDVNLSVYIAGGQTHVTSTDENGHYSVEDLPFGEFQITTSVNPEIYQAPVDLSATISASTLTAVRDFSLERWLTGTASVSGTVTDNDSDGVLSLAYLTLASDHVLHATSDENGAYSFTDLAPGEYTATVQKDGYVINRATVVIADGQATTLDLTMEAATSTIYGRIKDTAGLPIANLYLYAIPTDGSGEVLLGETATDANGYYTIDNLGSTEYAIHIGGTGTPYVERTWLVTTQPNQTSIVSLKLTTRTTGGLLGYVEDSMTHLSIEGLCTSLYRAGKTSPVARGVTGPDGTYSFTNVKPGSYTVRFRQCESTVGPYSYNAIFLGKVSAFADATFLTVVAAEDNYEGNISFKHKRVVTS